MNGTDSSRRVAAFEVFVSGEHDHPLVTVAGELDLGTAVQLRDALRAVPDDVAAVDVDLSEVTFIDSTALGVLLAAYKRFRVLGTAFGISGSSPVVSKVLEISGLSPLLVIDSPSAG